MLRGISDQEVLEESTVRSVGHFCVVRYKMVLEKGRRRDKIKDYEQI